MRKLFFMLSSIAILSCTDRGGEPGPWYENYYYINSSAHTIILQSYKGLYSYIDTIINNDTLTGVDPNFQGKSIFHSDSIIVLYDSIKIKKFINNGVISNRNIFYRSNYLFWDNSNKDYQEYEYNYYYTFTPQDYIEADTILK